MADKSTGATPAPQEVTSSGEETKQEMTSSGHMTQSPVVSGRIRGQPRGRGRLVAPRGRGTPLLHGENLEQSFSKSSPKTTRGSGQRGKTKTPMRSRRGRPRKLTQYSSESDEDKNGSEMESILTPDTRQQKSRANEKDGQSIWDGGNERKIKETDDVNETVSLRKRRGRPPGKTNQKSLEVEERGKKRGRAASDDSDAEKPGEEGIEKEEEEISMKRPRLRAESSGVTPRTTRAYRRNVPKTSIDEEEDSNKEEDSQKKTWRLEIEEKGQCVCPKCGCSRKTDTGMWSHFNKCQGKTAGHACTQCEAKFNTAAGLRYHLMKVHTTCTSPGQEEAVDERTRLKVILKKLGKLQCKKEGCSSSYTTLHGYEYHVQRCGKSKEEREVFTCDQCDKTYISDVGLRLHQRTIHAPSPEPQTVVEGTNSPAEDSGKGGETPGRAKRQAATKALRHLHELVIEGEEKETKERQRERSVKHLYSTPKLDITPQQTQQWTRDIKNGGSVECPYEDCSKTYCSLIGLKGHLPQCDKRPEGIGGTFNCLKCTREFRTVSGVEYHIRKIHNDSIGGLQDSGSEDEYDVANQEDFSSDDSISDEISEDEDDSSQPSRTPHKHKSKQRASYQPVRQAQEWTDSWKKQNYSDEVFPDWRPCKDQFSQLTGDGIEQYIPRTTHSLPITIQHRNNLKEPQAETIGLFESLSTHNERSFTFFVGGPVWGAEWCPTAQPHAAQYAAISCHRCMDARCEIDKVSMEPGMIQLWCLGDLENSSATDVPYLSLGLAHKFGAVWDMKWCPSGAWDPPQWNPSIQGDTDPPAVLPRLGLLAVASSDGMVRVISVPHPEALQPIREEQVSHHALHHMYLVKPVLQLVINTSGLHGNQPSSKHGQCFTVAWQPDEGHRRLAAGFHDGTVGIWDLQSESPLLRVSPPAVPDNKVPPTVLKNYLIFSAHDWVVTSVVWSETNSQFLATGSLDRHVKFWDLQVPNSPIQQTRWTAVRTLAWPLHFPGVFVAVDCSCYARSNMRSLNFFFASAQDDDNNRTLPITHHSATTWSVSYNPWRNCVVSADCAGAVVATVCPNLDPNTNRALFRFPVYTVDLRPCKGHDPIETSDPNCVPQSRTMHTVLSEQHTVTVEGEKKAASHNEPIMDQGSSALTNQNPALLNSSGNDGAQYRSLNLDGGQNGCVKTSDCGELGSDTSQQTKTGADPKPQELSRDILPQEKCPSALPLQQQEESTSFCQKKQNSTNLESVVHQDQARSQKQGQQKSERLAGDHQWGEYDDSVVLLSGCSDQEYSRTESESDGQKQHVTGKPSRASSNAANVQSHNPLGLSQEASGNTSHHATSVLSNGTAVSENSQGSVQQKPNCKPQDDSTPPTDLGAGVEKKTKKPLERELQNYADLVGKYELVFKDTDLTFFEKKSGDPEFLKLRRLDNMKGCPADRITVEAVHKVAWNPNPGCHIWLLSAGHAGIARVHCIKGLQKTSSKR